MNYYYGLVDKENRAWGFLEEGDPRVTEDMIFLTEEQWQGLLDEQSSGKEIVFYEGRVLQQKILACIMLIIMEFGKKR